MRSHNSANPDDVIERVLCPGLGTAVGRMPYLRCAMQMRTAFDAVILKNVDAINKPDSLGQCCDHHVYLVKVYYYTASYNACQFHNISLLYTLLYRMLELTAHLQVSPLKASRENYLYQHE